MYMKGKNYKVKRLWVKGGMRLSLQKHSHRDEHWIIVKGPVEMRVGGLIEVVQENESRMIKRGEKHRLENPNDYEVEVIEVQYGAYLSEDDIERYEDDYGRINQEVI